MGDPITVVSSKATQALLSELARDFEASSGCRVSLESVGGVDAAKRVKAGEVFDVVVLASGAIENLLAEGHLLSASQRDLVRSSVAVAVRTGARHPDITSENAVRQAVLDATSIGYSTGPSGVELAKLFERWGIEDTVRERVVVARPGVPVGALVASGEVELGFQQLSELLHVDGIDVVGPLPEPIQIVTTFSAAVGAASKRPELARTLISFLTSPAAGDAKRRQGMEPAAPSNTGDPS